MAEKNDLFTVLNGINVNDKTDKKNNGYTQLTYLSWVWAWAEVRKLFPTASYSVKWFEGKPYFYDPATGYMVFTEVTIEGETHEMWLPVMDSRNNSMKAEAYQVKTKRGPVDVEAATMNDINKTIMRCLTKNLAMFGLGLYIYAGEDLPEDEQEEKKAAKPAKAVNKPATKPIEKIYCENCKREIVGATSNGKTITAEMLAKKSVEFCGKALCGPCLTYLHNSTKAVAPAES